MSSLVRHCHPELGFEIDLPPDAEVIDDAAPVALVALEPEGPAFRANVVVTVEWLEPSTDVQRFTDDALAVQARVLDRMRLIDRAPAVLDGGPGTRTLCTHDADGQAVVLEQWRLVAGRWGYTASASAGALDYDEVTDVLAAAATSLRPPPEAG